MRGTCKFLSEPGYVFTEVAQAVEYILVRTYKKICILKPTLLSIRDPEREKVWEGKLNPIALCMYVGLE